MSYHHYTTEGVILKREDRGENDAVYVVFTETLGLIAAHATGIRLLKSKLRFALQVGNKVRITLVRGKALWRITTCALLTPLPTSIQATFPRVYKLLRTCIVFDEPLPFVYEHIRALVSLTEDVYQDKRLFRTAETLITARLLATMGMLDQVHTGEFDEISPLSASFCVSYQARGEALLHHIKTRLGESVL